MALIQYTQECLDAAEGLWPADGAPVPAGSGPRPRSIRVFKAGWIEGIFSKAHPITPILWFGFPIAYGLMVGTRRYGVVSAIGLFLGGWLAWTLMEYLLHRYFFHLTASTKAGRFRYFMVHGYHHEFPEDGMRLVAPPMMSWPLAVVTAALYYAVLGPNTFFTVLAGTMTGYIAYDWIHYYTHHAHPRRGVGKWLRAYHLRHHFQDHHTRYGVSSPLWDVILGTYRPNT
jgi:sterol desaturase/sphingolipid hydroxylase (fatty acid hydroxylase superfamily)